MHHPGNARYGSADIRKTCAWTSPCHERSCQTGLVPILHIRCSSGHVNLPLPARPATKTLLSPLQGKVRKPYFRVSTSTYPSGLSSRMTAVNRVPRSHRGRPSPRPHGHHSQTPQTATAEELPKQPPVRSDCLGYGSDRLLLKIRYPGRCSWSGVRPQPDPETTLMHAFEK